MKIDLLLVRKFMTGEFIQIEVPKCWLRTTLLSAIIRAREVITVQTRTLARSRVVVAELRTHPPSLTGTSPLRHPRPFLNPMATLCTTLKPTSALIQRLSLPHSHLLELTYRR